MIKVIALDIDGVLTDGRKYYDSSGNVQLKVFCDKDWTAIKRFRSLGINVVCITGDKFNVPILENRNLPVIVCRSDGEHRDKSVYLESICLTYGCGRLEICFVGDDLFDIGMMDRVGYAYCTADAPTMVKQHAIQLSCKGGENVVTILFDCLESRGLIPQQSYEEVMDKIYSLDVAEKF